ncbi:dienelactone hydrolase family protein [Nitrosomonas sp. Is24]|uniref:alpha/beta hydrolase n=1 Tax=Nitrosomonas sp. Is24 TaxID=3080533 RepID=UPI00294AED83|nr:dienelactone hydrolase family protein [Nitrosomonas sp. Is24]MDV6341384.1 dienelactone hydrolase family protein [Nitrosomonas sp. Is24]
MGIFSPMKKAIDLLPAVEIETGGSPAYAIVWLHGLGADGNDFVPIIDELTLPSGASIRFIFPHAPERPVTINNGYVMRAWYDIYRADFNDPEDQSGIRDSQQALDALIEREMQRGIPSGHIFLAGFSQGGAMALQTGLRQNNPLAGIIALSCYLPLAETLAVEACDANATTPVFMAHGIYDPVIPLSHAAASRDKLLATGYPLEWHEYPMAHSVCEAEIADISRWLRHIIG